MRFTTARPTPVPWERVVKKASKSRSLAGFVDADAGVRDAELDVAERVGGRAYAHHVAGVAAACTPLRTQVPDQLPELGAVGPDHRELQALVGHLDVGDGAAATATPAPPTSRASTATSTRASCGLRGLVRSTMSVTQIVQSTRLRAE